MKVCIIGSGLTGLVIAKALVNQNISVDMFTSKKKNKINYSRTIGISKSNVEFFHKSIINIKQILWKLKKIEVFTNNLKNEKILNFKNNSNEIFSIIKNYKLLMLLENNLKKNKYFRKIIQKEKLSFFQKYNLVINTDYSNHVTKKYFSKKIEKKYNCFAYTTIIEHEKIDNRVATQIFTDRGPLAFLPISNNQTSIVYSLESLNNYKEDIVDLIKKYNFKYKIKKIQKIDFFELKSLNLRSYYYKNILAFGDLLHRIHPLAGQGFNMTIRDLKVFLKIIKHRISLGLPLDSSINIEFEKKLKHKNFIFSNAIDLVYEFFNFERKSNNNIISKSVQFVGKNEKINKLLSKIADQGFVN
tara:strand:+ start:226 stop:1299 length:1074 start_codon:yes stop_codon:yes gene_type:complete